tara:strand:- start:3073 stop:4617 length:1545 start_codon:yes stop_codon:yes gene_type:complete
MNENEIKGNQDLYNFEEEDESEYEDLLQENAGIFSEALPAIVRGFQKSAIEVSHYNEIPAGISFFNLLGQIVKDFVIIPNGRNHEDTRVHFCWVQTSGTGKSTLWNFVGPVSDRVFQKINSNGKHPPLLTVQDGLPMPMVRTFNTFGVTDYTDSVLIGGYEKVMQTERDNEGNERQTGLWESERRPGILEGSGLAHWDEFEYSGIFNQSSHKEQAIVYLNTLMNSLSGESWIISKALASYSGEVMECFCERSVLAMTYPPSNLNEIIAEKGVLQRMLLYVWEVPEFIQHKMREEQIDKAGTIEEVNQPIDRYADALFNLYELTRERFNQVGGDPLKTMTFTPDFNAVLKLEYNNMKNYLNNTRADVAKLAGNFTTRLMKIMMKVSVLCSIASAPAIKKEEDRFIVTGTNVRQAATIVRQCYMTLVDWLERSLRVKRQSIAEASLEPTFMEMFKNMSEKSEDGLVNKAKYLKQVGAKTKKSQSQIYRHYERVRHKFEEEKHGRSTYIRKIGVEEQ